MPTRIKVIISIVVALVGIAAYWFQDGLGHVGPKYAVVALGVVMIAAMWLFPEVKRDAPTDPGRPGG